MTTVTGEKLDRVYDAYKSGKLSRRHFLKYLAMAGASMGIMGSPLGTMLADDARAAESIRFDGWGGVLPKPFASTPSNLLPKKPE